MAVTPEIGIFRNLLVQPIMPRTFMEVNNSNQEMHPPVIWVHPVAHQSNSKVLNISHCQKLSQRNMLKMERIILYSISTKMKQ